MKNVKLTLATTLSVLALTFAGAASADNGSRSNNHKQQNEVSFNKKASQHSVKSNTRNEYNTKSTYNAKNAYNTKKNVKRVVVKNSPNKKVIITKNIVKKPAKTQYVSKNRFNTKAAVTRNVKKVAKRNANRNVKHFSYTVRPGDTLYRISLRTGVSVNKIARLNRLTNWNLHNIRIGQTLRIS